jgi:acyl-CoA synthetase (AMP-forming)/AMP-acid ligase II
MNLGAFLTRAAALDPGRAAVTAGARRLTYAELNARVDALAAGLTGLGLAAGDRVVLWMRNRPEFVESFFACWKLGLVAVPVNPRLRGVDVAFHAADSGASALVHGPEFTDDAASVDVAHRVGAGDEGSYDALVAANTGAADRTRPVPDDAPAWLFYTSGTTGRPKGAVLTHGNLTFVAVSWCADLYRFSPRTSCCTARR